MPGCVVTLQMRPLRLPGKQNLDCKNSQMAKDLDKLYLNEITVLSGI